MPQANSWCYSLSTDVLGAVLEKVCGKSLSDIVADSVTRPLGMHDTGFHIDVRDEKYTRLSTAYADAHETGAHARIMEERDSVLLSESCGLIHYAPSRIMTQDAYASGGAGISGTARDYIKFIEVIRTGGGGIISQDSVNLMTQDLVPTFDVPAAGPGYGFGMGFAVIRDSAIAGTPRKPGSFEWGGVFMAAKCLLILHPGYQ